MSSEKNVDDSQDVDEKKNRYHESSCGSILLPLPKKCASEVFTYLRHGQFDRFQRCFSVYHQELIHLKNEHGQTILHILTIHAYAYQWIRALLMRGCDPCWQDNDGYTAVHYAIERDDVEILKALTVRFYSEIKLFPEEIVKTIHSNCLKALTLREKDGMTAFMLACFHQSFKCLNYLLQLQINDVHLQDKYGDTCLHYAVSRRNKVLVSQLLNQYQADVNGGDTCRPSVLDIVQFNREQQRMFDRDIDDSIEQMLLSRQAVNRSQIQRTGQQKRSIDHDEVVVPEHPSLDSRIRTARNYARLAAVSEKNGDLPTREDFYRRAMNTAPSNTLDWTDYASKIAMIHQIRGENQIALDLFQRVLIVRKQLENQSDEIDRIEHIIQQLSCEHSK